MIRSCVRQAVRVFAGAAFFSYALAAHAGSITLSDANCDSFTLTGSPGNQTLSCVVSNAPTGCSIQGPSTGTNNNAITLTAVCATGSPTTYAWSGGNCAGIGTQSCSAVDSNATRNYSVVISNAIGPGTPNPATKSVVWSNALPVAPSNCSITPNPGSLPVGGGGVSLTAQCAGGDPVDTWTWSNATYTTMTGNTATATIASTTVFKVNASNGGGNANAQVSVSVAGGGGTLQCSGYLNTNVITMNWPNWISNQTLNMGSLDAGIVKFTTGASISGNVNAVGKLTAGSASGSATTKHDVTLSDTPCDFGPGLKRQVAAGTANIYFVIGQPGASVVNLQPNTTYYFNIRNNDTEGCVANGTTCDLFPVNLSKPPGL